MAFDLCLYHANCTDGVTAAAVVLKRFPKIDLKAVSYGEALPENVDGKNVVVVDFSYKPDPMLELVQRAARVLVLDHHKTAQETLQNLPGLTQLPLDASWKAWAEAPDRAACVFDMERSGAGLAWDFFYPGAERPLLIDLVEDRDLWRFKLDGTREVHAYLGSLELTPAPTLNAIGWLQKNLEVAKTQGATLLRQHDITVRETIKAGRTVVDIGGVRVPCCNAGFSLASDIGNLLSVGEPFAATYFDTGAGRNWSLRSQPDGLDVSEIAQRFGGGGHARAAGFRTTRGWFGDRGPIGG